jgi:hypothetical protein
VFICFTCIHSPSSTATFFTAAAAAVYVVQLLQGLELLLLRTWSSVSETARKQKAALLQLHMQQYLAGCAELGAVAHEAQAVQMSYRQAWP